MVDFQVFIAETGINAARRDQWGEMPIGKGWGFLAQQVICVWFIASGRLQVTFRILFTVLLLFSFGVSVVYRLCLVWLCVSG